MRTGILTILAYFVMCSVSYASDVYITQSGASLTANINQDGQTNKFGDGTTGVTLTGDNQTLDIDQIGNTNTCLLYTSPSPRDRQKSRMPSSA